MKRFVLLALLASSPGCMSRYLVTLQDGPTTSGTQLTTTLETTDIKSYVVAGMGKHVFWECEEQGEALHCEKKCDVKDETGQKVACPKFNTFGW